MNIDNDAAQTLRALADQGLQRQLVVRDPADRAELPSLATNDYLQLSSHPEVIAAACAITQRCGLGSTSSRLIAGTLPQHLDLERRISLFQGAPQALVFSCGYLANIGVLGSVVQRNDLVIADKLIHASLIDGIQLSRARLLRFAHNDLEHFHSVLKKCAETRSSSARIFVVTESLFSMDGDYAPLLEMAALCEQYEAAFIVDEAHALGVCGPGGRGLVRAAVGIEPTFVTGSCGKALGGAGGYALCSQVARELLVHTSRAFIFNTSPPPGVIAGICAALDVIGREPTLGATLLSRAERFSSLLRNEGLNVGRSRSHIIPLMVGSSADAVSLARRLSANGVVAPAIRAPTVPEGSARIRFSITLAHDEIILEEVANRVIRCIQEEGLCV